VRGRERVYSKIWLCLQGGAKK